MSNIRELPNTGEIAVPKDSLRAWAARNAYLLCFLSGMFGITWVLSWIFN